MKSLKTSTQNQGEDKLSRQASEIALLALKIKELENQNQSLLNGNGYEIEHLKKAVEYQRVKVESKFRENE